MSRSTLPGVSGPVLVIEGDPSTNTAARQMGKGAGPPFFERERGSHVALDQAITASRIPSASWCGSHSIDGLLVAKDTLDSCRFGVFSGQGGVVDEGRPVTGGAPRTTPATGPILLPIGAMRRPIITSTRSTGSKASATSSLPGRSAVSGKIPITPGPGHGHAVAISIFLR